MPSQNVPVKDSHLTRGKIHVRLKLLEVSKDRGHLSPMTKGQVMFLCDAEQRPQTNRREAVTLELWHTHRGSRQGSQDRGRGGSGCDLRPSATGLHAKEFEATSGDA